MEIKINVIVSIITSTLFMLPTIATSEPRQVDVSKLNIVTLETGSTEEASNHYSIDEVIKHIKKQNPIHGSITIKDTEAVASPIITNVYSGAPSPAEKTNTIFIHVRGYAGICGSAKYKFDGSGFYSATKMIQAQLMSGTCVSFDMQTEAFNKFDFGQENDQASLSSLCNKIINENPTCKIVFLGTCKGSVAISHFLACQANQEIIKKHIKGTILFSPSVSLNNLTKSIAKTKVSWLPFGHTVIHGLFKLAFPSYNPNAPTLLDIAHKVNKNLPMLIIGTDNDKVVPFQDLDKIVRSLQKSGKKNLHFLTIDDNKYNHASVIYHPKARMATNAFLKEYGLPHMRELAESGENILNSSRI